MAAPSCPLFGDGATGDMLLPVASYPPAAKELLRLQLTNKRSGIK